MFLHKRPQTKRGRRIGWIWWVAWTDESGKKHDQSLQKHFRLSLPVTDPWVAKKLLADLEMKEVHDRLGVPDDFGSLSVDEFYLKYLRYCDRNKAPNTVKSDKERLGKWIRFLKAQKVERVAQITLNVFRGFSEQELRGNANATQNRYASIVRASFNWGIREGYLKKNPLQNVIRLKEVRRPRSASFRFGDLKKLLSIEDKIFLAYIKLIYYTLMRRSEALNLRWNDVDFKNKTIYLKNTKNQVPRMVPINKRLISILKGMESRTDAGHIFPWTENQVTKKFQRLRKRFDLEIDGIHHFRHLRASELIRKGANVRAVQWLLGHSDPRITLGIYVHVNLNDLRKAVEM